MDNIPKEKVSECEVCKWRESEIGYYSPCPKHDPSHLKEEPPTEKLCCGGLGYMGKCGRGTKKGCNGVHCKCMEKYCPNMHYTDCFEHYIHVEFRPEKKEKEIQPKSEKKIEKLIPIDLSHTKEDSLARDIYGPMNKISAKINEIIDYLNE